MCHMAPKSMPRKILLVQYALNKSLYPHAEKANIYTFIGTYCICIYFMYCLSTHQEDLKISFNSYGVLKENPSSLCTLQGWVNTLAIIWCLFMGVSQLKSSFYSYVLVTLSGRSDKNLQHRRS